MSSAKRQGPDGINPNFYKTYWGMVGEYLIKAIQHFFSTTNLHKVWNYTFITLVSKSNQANKVEQYRPIALCNVAFKIITKLIATRLRPFLEKIVAPELAAFIPGWHITNNTIINQEIMHQFKQKKGKIGFMAIKVDMAKIYDRVEWEILKNILVLDRFDERSIRLIMECITTSSFSIC